RPRGGSGASERRAVPQSAARGERPHTEPAGGAGLHGPGGRGRALAICAIVSADQYRRHHPVEFLYGLGGLRRLPQGHRSEEHTSELQSLTNLVCRLLLEKKK